MGIFATLGKFFHRFFRNFYSATSLLQSLKRLSGIRESALSAVFCLGLVYKYNTNV